MTALCSDFLLSLKMASADGTNRKMLHGCPRLKVHRRRYFVEMKHWLGEWRKARWDGSASHVPRVQWVGLASVLWTRSIQSYRVVGTNEVVATVHQGVPLSDDHAPMFESLIHSHYSFPSCRPSWRTDSSWTTTKPPVLSPQA